MVQKASIGRIVHYYQGDWECTPQTPDGYGTNGTRIHPAMITHVHTDSCVNLIVFLDGSGGVVKTSMCELPDEVFKDGMHCTNSGWRWPPHV